MCRQYKDGPLRTVANQPDTGPDMNGMFKSIPTLGNEYNAVVCCFLNVIDCTLEGSRLVGAAIRSVDIRGLGIVRPDSIDRL